MAKPIFGARVQLFGGHDQGANLFADNETNMTTTSPTSGHGSKSRQDMNSKSANRSGSLMTLFSVSALLSVAVILIATYIGIRTVYTHNVISIAEQQSVSISQALFIQERDLLTAGVAGATSLRIADKDFARVDKRMHDYLRPFNIVKIKAFDTDRRIIYSTDSSIIGKLQQSNTRLETALGGQVDAELETKEKVVDLSEETRFHVDVVETYVPVTNNAGDVIGSLEIYMDVTGYRDRLSTLLKSSMLVIATILLLTFGGLLLIMRRGTDRLAQYEEKLHSLATTDVLTGVANRRYLMNRADDEFSRLRRGRTQQVHDHSAGCILVDVDHFKRVNDSYGHQVGDAVLRELGERFKHCVRRYDTVGRYGGEEFLIITPNSALPEVAEIAQRVARIVRERAFVVEDLRLEITVSVGYACIQEQDASVNDMIKRADDALYEAKVSGRDRVICLACDGEPASISTVPIQPATA